MRARGDVKPMATTAVVHARQLVGSHAAAAALHCGGWMILCIHIMGNTLLHEIRQDHTGNTIEWNDAIPVL
jgi:hypothetical protein